MCVQVVIPKGFTQEDIDELLARRATYIQRQLAIARNKGKHRRRDQILYLGELYTFRPLAGLRRGYAINPTSKTIFSGIDLLADGNLQRWYRKEAKRVIEGRIVYYASIHRFSYNRVFIRGQRTLWGSCSSGGNLSFNWRLIQTPLEVIDYVVVHELVHTELLRHTDAFWARVKAIYPQYRQARAWLRYYEQQP